MTIFISQVIWLVYVERNFRLLKENKGIIYIYIYIYIVIPLYTYILCVYKLRIIQKKLKDLKRLKESKIQQLFKQLNLRDPLAKNIYSPRGQGLR